MNRLDKLKIFVCCHAPYEVPKIDGLIPIQVGTALANEHFNSYVYDNIGENISHKNNSYCELTAHYWAWKNEVAKYYGFFHYRRYLYPDLLEKRPYLIRKYPNERTLYGLKFPIFESLISEFDIIVPKGENMWVSVEEHYKNAPFHRAEDLDLMKSILLEQSPEYSKAMEDYFAQTVSYFGNMFVMKHEIFRQYCEFLFPILELCEEKIDLSIRGVQEARVFGYLAERLLGVFYTQHKERLNCLELPRVHFEPDPKRRIKGKILGAVLPAGTRRRKWVKGRLLVPWKKYKK